MIGVVQRDDSLALGLAAVDPVLDCELQCDFDRSRAVIGVEHTSQSRWQDFEQAFGELYGRTMRASGKDDVFQLASLLRQRRVELGMRMTVNVHPPGRNAV